MATSRLRGRRSATFVLVCTAVAGIAGVVMFIGFEQRDGVRAAANSTNAASAIMSSVIDAHDALEDYVANRGGEQLERLAEDRLRAGDALDRARSLAGGDVSLLGNLASQAALIGQWNALTRSVVARRQLTERHRTRIDEIYDALQGVNESYSRMVTERRTAALSRATLVEGGVVVVGSALALAVALLFGRRNAFRARARADLEAMERSEQRELVESLQIASGEDETYALLRKHIARTLPVADVVVLNRDNSNDRLEARTDPPAALRDALTDASPESCLAVRVGRLHSHGPERQPLLACDLCGRFERATCVPSLVGGAVIGSVLASHAHPLDDRQQARLHEAVSQAAPVLANLRNLSIAETRAMTDALTGLANVRALQDNLKRMLAQAGRNASPLSLLALDLDHFKRINDLSGHDKGDEALAAVGDLLDSSLRASDFAARNGGEEFVIVLPDTPKDGATRVAEGLRAKIERIAIPGIEQPITASIGVASFPEDATEPALLLRSADRALYLAKANGRNTVQQALPPSSAARA
jgi:diguanylate cyclase (GGDEF)-like protein